jgi:hypothetical protein
MVLYPSTRSTALPVNSRSINRCATSPTRVHDSKMVGKCKTT